MIRRAGPADLADIDAFLRPRTGTSMFLRGNLARHGVGRGEHPHSTDIWLWPGTGPIRGVFGLTASGMAMVQAPDAPPEVFAAVADALAGRAIAGVTGVPGQVCALLSACGLTGARFSLDHDEPLYRLDLSALPDPGADLRRATPEDTALLEAWFTEYLTESGLATGPAATMQARDRAVGALAGDSTLRLLLQDGVPVAMAAINAAVADHVQVGGVFVRKVSRRQGIGATVTTALLAEARENGAATAILFANGPDAARVYERIGFARIGTYRLAILAKPVEVAP